MAGKREVVGALRVVGVEFWGVSIGLGYIGWSVASRAFYPSIAMIVAALVLGPLLGSFTFLINNAVDKDFDSRNSRKAGSPIISGAISTKKAMTLAFVFGILALTISLSLGFDFFATSVGMCAIAYAYSAPPFRLKERPGLDVLSTGFGLGVLCPLAGYSLVRPACDFPIWYLLAIFLIMIGLYVPTTVADHEGDVLNGIRTFSVAVGKRRALLVGICAFALGSAGIALESALGYVLAPRLLYWTWCSLLVPSLVYASLFKFNSHDDIIKGLLIITLLEFPGPLLLSAMTAGLFIP